MLAKLENAHIRGGAGRTHDRRNILRLCNGCHRLAHGERIVVFGDPLPVLTTANLLWLKAAYDPDCYDWDYLHELRPIPATEQEPRKPDDWFFDVRINFKYKLSTLVTPEKAKYDDETVKIILTLRGTEADKQRIVKDAKFANQCQNEWVRTCLRLDD